jgi:hypothetical protein
MTSGNACDKAPFQLHSTCLLPGGLIGGTFQTEYKHEHHFMRRGFRCGWRAEHPHDIAICPTGNPLMLQRRSGKPVTTNATDELLFLRVQCSEFIERFLGNVPPTEGY